MPEVAPSDRLLGLSGWVLDFCYETRVVLALYALQPLGAVCDRLRLRMKRRGPVEDLIVVYLNDGSKVGFSCVSESGCHGREVQA